MTLPANQNQAVDPAFSEWGEWVNSPAPVQFVRNEPIDIIGSVDHVVASAISLRNTSDTSWSMGGEMGVVLASIVARGLAPHLTMVLLPGDKDGGLVISVIMSLGNKAVIAEKSNYQLMVDMLVGGPPSNLPPGSIVTVALPGGPVIAPVKWAGNRQGILEVTGNEEAPWRIIWGDRVDEAHMIGAAPTS